MKYAFINADSVVVNVINGTLTVSQQTQFLRDYGILFNAVEIIEVDAGTPVWIGGTYTDGTFFEPVQMESISEPEILVEPIMESEPL